MKYLISAFFIMTAAVSAQEYWGNPNLVWEDGTGFGQYFNPCFTNNPDQILISTPIDSYFNRIVLVTGMWQGEQFFPDSVIGDRHDDTPFMTADGNIVYFSSDRSGGHGGFDIWYTENINGSWTMPLNLGPAINSDLDEISPSLTADYNEIFFIRGDYYGFDYIINGEILSSEFSGGQWQDPIVLPETINSDSAEYSPSISGDGSKLYFISHRENSLPGWSAVWVSDRTGNNWATPYLPDGCINQYYQDCPPWWDWYGHPMSVCIGAGNTEIVYVKSHHFECIEASSLVYTAELMTAADDSEIPYPASLSLAVYPNPFNSSVNISAVGVGDGHIQIYNLLGQKLRQYDIDRKGESIAWDGKTDTGKDCPSGIYFVKLNSGQTDISRAVTLLR